MKIILTEEFKKSLEQSVKDGEISKEDLNTLYGLVIHNNCKGGR